MPQRSAGTTFAAIFAGTGVYLVASLVLAVSGRALPGLSYYLAFPGIILFEVFSWAAFYVPAYLLCSAAMTVAKTFRRDLVFLLTVSMLPFLTVSAFLRILFGASALPGVAYLTDMLGRRGAASALIILTALEIFVIARLRLLLFSGPPAASNEYTDLSEPARRVVKKLDLRPPARESVPDESGKSASGGEIEPPDPAQQALPDFSFPKIRELPPLVTSPRIEDESGVEDAEVIGEEIEEGEGVDADEDDIDLEEPIPARVPVHSVKPASVAAGSKRKGAYNVPAEGILDDYPDGSYWEIDDVTRTSSEVLKTTLEEFRIQAEVTGIRKGPVITMFEILPAPGVKLSKISNLADNIALRLAASRVRIVAPIPGKHAVGIEVPNKKRAIVSFKEMVRDPQFTESDYEIPIILGKDIAGEAQIIDLVQTPHLLIAGATGSGKSVCVNSIIASILYSRNPRQVRLILIDPKIVELKLYNDIPHLLTPVVTEPKRAFQALQYCIFEMERRYSMLDKLGVRDIRSYNRKIEQRNLAQEPLPYMVIIVDEFADLMATTGKELESTLARLAAMSRAIGIHLVLATQRPSIDVITGLIKANIPSRIAFMVAGKFDSRIIIDTVGADKLLGRGDMLFTSAWDPVPNRIQGAFLSEHEVERMTDYVKTLGEPDYIDDEIFYDEEGEDFGLFSEEGDDPLMTKALEIVLNAGKASASYLQRRLKIGYNRAARLVEDMERKGIVGPQQGSKPRDILHVPDDM